MSLSAIELAVLVGAGALVLSATCDLIYTIRDIAESVLGRNG